MGHGPELAGQTVVVIGGSAGIGLETARHAEGVDVVISGRGTNPMIPHTFALEPGLRIFSIYNGYW